MGAADWVKYCSEKASTAMTATTQTPPEKAIALSPRARDSRKKPTRFSRLRLQGSAMLNAKDLLHQTVVTKLYPAMTHFRLSPLRGSTRFKNGQRTSSSFFTATQNEHEGECGEPEKEVENNEPSVELAAKWLMNEASVRFAQEVKFMAAAAGCKFEMTSEGCGGAYFLTVPATTVSATGRPVCSKKMTTPLGIFKPRDEEYMAPMNPRGYVKENAEVGVTEHPVNKGFRVGNGALRECAAYLLDDAYGGFSGVPVTNLMVLEVNGEAKEGSMQRFAPSQCSAEDMGTLKFAIPEVHKIGILDVRLFNTDRHAGNILLSPRANDQTFGMTPIDHGFCLPSYKHLDAATFDWLQWPQAQFPFTCAELDHIASLDAQRDAAVLRALGIQEACVTTMRVCTAVLQLGAEAGFSLFEIGSLLQRDGDFSTPTQLEDVVAKTALYVEQSLGLSEEKDGSVFYDEVVAEVTRQADGLFEDQPKKKVRSISCFR